ncbi:unnamed protein product [Didymodactylos carnosus]|uniref:Double-strand-break repair protein rad21 n=2 Tax=Didymodactylos carnosus TaxID=1234261 RepID=A0A813YC34_9BILA|nr:unnamed protein product [Didymodactylos carnosus]CAF3668053.1 unnamed protein product [Didymodactylos carnosus]
MFYTHAILTKRGPLARLWLAAHWDKKLTKAQIFETDIRASCESILEPCLKLALRTKGHLLLGVVRIYSRKTKYLLADCNEAFIKIKMAFRPGIVSTNGAGGGGQDGNLALTQDGLQGDQREVSIAAITLPENFHEFDGLIDLDIDYIDDPSRFQLHQARAEEITLKEDFITVPMPLDDDFGDYMDDSDIFRKNLQSTLHYNNSVGYDAIRKDHSLMNGDQDEPFFDDIHPPASVISAIGIGGDNSNLSAQDQYDHVMSPFAQDEISPLDDHQPPPDNQDGRIDLVPSDNNHMDVGNDYPALPLSKPVAYDRKTLTTGVDDTTLLSNASDEFVLPPIATRAQDVTLTRTTRHAKRKRKLLIDDIKEIDSQSMKTQLSDTSDIVGVLELAPPTRRLMHWKETGGVEKLFTLTATQIFSKSLQQLIQRNMITKSLLDMPNYVIEPDELSQQSIDEARRAAIGDLNLLHGGEQSLMLHDKNQTLSPRRRSPHKKRTLSKDEQEEEEQQQDKRRRTAMEQQQDMLPPLCDMLPPMDSMLPPLSDNLMMPPPSVDQGGPLSVSGPPSVLPPPHSPMRRSTRKNQSEQKSTPSKRRERKTTFREEEEEDEEDGETPTAQDDFESGRKLSRRGRTMLQMLEKGFEYGDAVSFHNHLTSTSTKSSINRKVMAQKFYTLLVLKKLQAVDVEQMGQYEDILVTKAKQFDRLLTINE